MDPVKDGLASVFNARFFKWVIIGSLGTFFLVFLITSPLLIKPRYSSEALIYVPLTLFSQQFDQQGIGFGGNAEIDGHIQILQSSLLLDSLNARFGLAETWKIDSLESGASHKLYGRIRSKVKIGKTRYNSVSVKVSDSDPVMAADIANAIVELGDLIKEDILRENRLSAYDFAKKLYEEQNEEVLRLESAFESIRDAGSGIRISGIGLNREQTIYEAALWELNSRKSRYEMISRSLQMPLPKSYIVSPAVVAHKPSWPPRLLLSLAAVAIFAVFLIFVEIIRQDAA